MDEHRGRTAEGTRLVPDAPRERGHDQRKGKTVSERPNNHHRPQPPRVWEYVLPGGLRVLAGKTDGDNDRLSLSVAGANDWWFHVRGMPGSHVVLQVAEGPPPDRKTLEQAAAIAAYHSKARGGGIVAVSGTLARYVKKPHGAKPGSVQIRKERVFKVRPALPG
jgi:predicted ribosome quality control (RQC) complex YloA/Tae2 family protein